ncbi:hypothetical protein [Streptomyces sp. NPDC002088]|uniref:hypothetical protein n=1 Tax=Streptomyces sp. NPDC002088 TaxID=3154665 RepID=UPI00332C18E6
MRIRRILAAVIATAALTGIGVTSTTTAQAAARGVSSSTCKNGGGTVTFDDHSRRVCEGGTYDGYAIG